MTDDPLKLTVDMVGGLKAAHDAYQLYSGKMLEFQERCKAFDWAGAEVVRAEIEALHDLFLTHFAGAYKRLESEG